jgi:hypothetical protein
LERHYGQDTLELFNLHRVRRCRQLVVVEGCFDAIRLHGLRIGAVALHLVRNGGQQRSGRDRTTLTPVAG